MKADREERANSVELRLRRIRWNDWLGVLAELGHELMNSGYEFVGNHYPLMNIEEHVIFIFYTFT